MTDFSTKQIKYELAIILKAPPEIVFPLFTPEEEKKWAAGWDFELIWPENYEMGPDMVFKTASHDHAEQEALWIVHTYDPDNYCVTYLRLEPVNKIGRIDIRCRPYADRKTQATVSYKYTALSESGNRFIETYTESAYQEYLQFWETAINHYLETGTTYHPG